MSPGDTSDSSPDNTVISVRPSLERVSGVHCGRVLSGKYKLVKVLGSGGMGEVYQGEHVTLGTPIAVKTMHPHIAAQPDLARRFGREAHAASRLRHPNVVNVLDYGEDEGLFYIVMELLSGLSVGEWLSRRVVPPPLSEVATILVPVLDALGRAHADGIVHRDLKTENIFLAEESGQRVVKVLDFGLAHVEDPHDGGPTLTKTDAMGGTPEYMSPEQCRSLSVGPSADLYAIGCVLTALLQLKPPFYEGSPMDVISRHMFLPPPPLARPREVAEVPPLLERLRLDLLAKSPSKRPPNAAAVKERLLEAMSPEATLLRLPTRKGDEPLGPRDQRIPSWGAGSVGKSRARQSGGAAADAKVALVRVRSAEGGVGPECVTGLAAQSLHVTEASGPAEVGDLAPSAVILDAGTDIEGACEWLRRLAALATPAARAAPARAIVCADKPTIEAINALIAAGAADVMTYPVSPDTLGKKLARLLRRGR